MTKLEAVNEVLEALGEPPVTALDTSGTSLEAQAENTLDRIVTRIQKRPWAINEKVKVTLAFATRLLTVGAVTSGPYTYDETVTEATTGATGKFKYLDGTSMYLEFTGSLAFDGATRVLTGATSGATCTDSAVSTITESKIATDTAWLKVGPHREESVNFAMRESGFLYDRDDNTETFDADVKANIVTELTWTNLTTAMQDYMVAVARLQFEKFKNAGAQTNQLLAQELRDAQMRAFQEDGDFRRANLNNTPHARRLLGDRLIVH